MIDEMSNQVEQHEIEETECKDAFDCYMKYKSSSGFVETEWLYFVYDQLMKEFDIRENEEAEDVLNNHIVDNYEYKAHLIKHKKLKN